MYIYVDCVPANITETLYCYNIQALLLSGPGVHRWRLRKVVSGVCGNANTSVVLVHVSWLEQVATRTSQVGRQVVWNVRRGNGWADDTARKEHEDQRVQREVLSHHPLTQTGLLQREDGWTDLARWSQPEQHDGVQRVDAGDDQQWSMANQDDVAQDEISRKLRHLNDLDKVLTARLCEGGTSSAPLPTPERGVRVVVLVFTREQQNSHALEDESLQLDTCDNTDQHLDKAETLENPHNNETTNVTNNCNTVGECGKTGAWVSAAAAQHRVGATRDRHAEGQSSHVNGNWAQCADNDTKNRVHSVVISRTGTGLGVDEGERDETTSTVDDQWENLSQD